MCHGDVLRCVVSYCDALRCVVLLVGVECCGLSCGGVRYDTAMYCVAADGGVCWSGVVRWDWMRCDAMWPDVV